MGTSLAILLILLIAFYFLPTIIAANRHHPNSVAIFCINLFLGWSLIGWVVALVWAVSAMNETQQTIQIINPGGQRDIQTQPVGPAASKEPVTTDTNTNVADELLKLHQLKEKGVITEAEFQEQKALVLNRSSL